MNVASATSLPTATFSYFYMPPVWTKNAVLPVSHSWAIMFERGHQFGKYVLKEAAPISFEKSAGSVVVTLLCAGVAESGENEAEALENLAWFINNLIEEREANPNQPLGKRLAKQIEILQDTFQRVGTNQ